MPDPSSRCVLGTAVLDTVGHLAAFLPGLSPCMPAVLPRSDHQICLQTLTGVPRGMNMRPPVASQCSLGRLVPRDICSGWEDRKVMLAPPAVTFAHVCFGSATANGHSLPWGTGTARKSQRVMPTWAQRPPPPARSLNTSTRWPHSESSSLCCLLCTQSWAGRQELVLCTFNSQALAHVAWVWCGNMSLSSKGDLFFPTRPWGWLLQLSLGTQGLWDRKPARHHSGTVSDQSLRSSSTNSKALDTEPTHLITAVSTVLFDLHMQVGEGGASWRGRSRQWLNDKAKEMFWYFSYGFWFGWFCTKKRISRFWLSRVKQADGIIYKKAFLWLLSFHTFVRCHVQSRHFSAVSGLM